MSLKQTPSQTVGPYFAYGLTPGQYGYEFGDLVDGNLLTAETEGEKILLAGQVLDGAGEVVREAMLEIWQADAQGRYAHPADERGSNLNFKGFGRYGTGTDPEGRFIFNTIKPGAPADGEAPYINVIVFMRGLLSHVYTRIYFSDLADANDKDPVLSTVDPARRGTLIAERKESSGFITYNFDIVMQGDNETVFFEL